LFKQIDANFHIQIPFICFFSFSDHFDSVRGDRSSSTLHYLPCLHLLTPFISAMGYVRHRLHQLFFEISTVRFFFGLISKGLIDWSLEIS
jgi:hypothetical protein